MSTLAATTVASIFAEHKQFVWGLCYRLTGSAADADDLVQETFVRVIERPPVRTNEPWRPWLVRVAMNLGRDALRRHRRHSYIGPWLPSPIETGEEESPPSYEPVAEGGISTEGRYDLIESVSFAFLLALEALTPQQRAVLLLRDVFDYSVRETASALGMTEANVKTVHHRARRKMRDYDQDRCIPTRALSEDVLSLSDGAGEFHAARVPIIGRERVTRFYANISGRRAADVQIDIRLLNGLPAVVAAFSHGLPGEPPRTVLICNVRPDGQIQALHAVVATQKLTAVRF